MPDLDRIISVTYTTTTLERDGNTIGISECPQGCGRIKSPMCCGSDMEAAA